MKLSREEIETSIKILLDKYNGKYAILFGSYARGDADPGSDIDELLLVDASRQDISDRNWQVGNLAAELLLNHGIVVSPFVENREYFNRNLQLFPFYRGIEREGVRISA